MTNRFSSPSPDILIIGSGAGGAVLARELARNGQRVLVLEAGQRETHIGTTADSLRYYDVNRLTRTPFMTPEGVILWRALMAGGSTVVSCGNATRCLETELAAFGIDLSAEFARLESEMTAAPVDENLLSSGSRRIRAAALELGYEMQLMPKFVSASRCRKCGQCVLGCRYGAKWTALDALDEAVEYGAEVLYGARVEQILHDGRRALGVVMQRGGQTAVIRAGTVVLAAGGLASPAILQRSGIREAGSGLFVDLFVNTYGVTRDFNQVQEPTMALVDLEFHHSQGFLISPFANHARLARGMELGPAGFLLPTHRLIGLMTKITDEASGRVDADGSIHKGVTERDAGRLQSGSQHCARILARAGADPASIVVSRPQGAHPGGTAAIGKVLDTDLQTRINGLYVCDASALPAAPGLPPILTISALAVRLANHLSGETQSSRAIQLQIPALSGLDLKE